MNTHGVTLRTRAAIAAGKLAGAASRISRRGGGTAIAGLAASPVDGYTSGGAPSASGLGSAGAARRGRRSPTPR